LLRIADNGLAYYQFESLAGFAESGKMQHGIFTRLGGVSIPPFATLNTGHMVGDDPLAVRENHRRICQALDADVAAIASGYQAHGSDVAFIGPQDGGRVRPASDILLTDQPNIPLMQRFADCTPLVLYDPAHQVLGLAHAGWRGVVQGVALKSVQAMTLAFGSCPGDIVAGIGPSIGPCCYEIGSDVVTQVQDAFRESKRWLLAKGDGAIHLDLWAANHQQLQAAGVSHIDVAEICTACHTQEFFSHRAERGRTGRFGVMAVLY
jgi:YfiH family protein